MNIEKAVAEILVECGYAKSFYKTGDNTYLRVQKCCEQEKSVSIAPFSDTLEGRRQADALEDWLINTQKAHAEFNFMADPQPPKNYYRWRLFRIKWCIKRLEARS